MVLYLTVPFWFSLDIQASSLVKFDSCQHMHDLEKHCKSLNIRYAFFKSYQQYYCNVMCIFILLS